MSKEALLIGNIAIIIRGKDTLNFDRLKKLDFGNFSTSYKGILCPGEYTTIFDVYAEKGSKFKLNDVDEFPNVFKSYIDMLVPYKEIIKEFSNEYEAVIRIFLDTTMQNAVSIIPHECLKGIVDMGLSLEISIWA